MSLLWHHLLILPIVLPLTGAICAALVRGRQGGWIVLIITGLSAGINGWILYLALHRGPLVYRIGGWLPPQGIVLVVDVLSAMLALVAATLAVAAALYALTTGEQLQRPRYHALFLVMLTALCGVFFTGDLFNLYVFMEMVILSSVILVAMAERPTSAEVTFKYTLISALGSTFLLFSIGLIYAPLGTLNMADIARRMQSGPAPAIVSFGAAMMLAVFLLKAGIVPFHFWLPDAHSNAPSAVSAMLSGVLVKVGVYGTVRMVTLLFPNGPGLAIVGALGALSAIVGGLAALANDDLKRLLAYSTISNVGLILIAVGWGTRAGLMAAVIHIVNHALIKGSLFLAGGSLADRYHEHSLRQLTGLAALAPGIMLVFGIGALSLAGLPPTNGFVSKLMLIQAGWLSGGFVLLLAAVLASALGIAYSTRVFVRLFWGITPAWVLERSRQLVSQQARVMAAALLVMGILLLGIWPSLLVHLGDAAVDELQQPQIYIDAVLEESP